MTQSLDRAISMPALTRFAMPTIVSMLCAGLYGAVDGVLWPGSWARTLWRP